MSVVVITTGTAGANRWYNSLGVDTDGPQATDNTIAPVINSVGISLCIIKSEALFVHYNLSGIDYNGESVVAAMPQVVWNNGGTNDVG